MFGHLLNAGSDNSFWGTSQGSQVAQQKLMTNGMTSGGAESILKGSIPKNSVDKLKLANAYGGGAGKGNATKPDPNEMLKKVGPALRGVTKKLDWKLAKPKPEEFSFDELRSLGSSASKRLEDTNTAVQSRAKTGARTLIGDAFSWFLE